MLGLDKNGAISQSYFLVDDPESEFAEPVSYQPRFRRRSRPRGRTIATKRMSLREIRADNARPENAAILAIKRPTSRDECAPTSDEGDHCRPCPWVGCKWHLYLDVNPDSGSIQYNFPDVAPEDLHRMRETCALDVGETTLEKVGGLMNLTRERVRQIELRALAKLKAPAVDLGLTDVDEVRRMEAPPRLVQIRRRPERVASVRRFDAEAIARVVEAREDEPLDTGWDEAYG